ncbi:MAG: hypothetical protein CL811_06445 [Colwelliaceae bacterium]|nr:hypothetical protein [Colwelliaceae bacterium]
MRHTCLTNEKHYMIHKCLINFMLTGEVVKAKFFALSAVLLLTMVLLWIADESASEPTEPQQQQSVLTVSAIKVSPTTIESQVSAFGVAKARWALDVISPVAGKVQSLPVNNEPGTEKDKQDLLVSIADTAYQYELSTAKARVTQAELELARYQHEQYVAKQVNGKMQQSAFGRFEPHIKFAQAELAAAKAQVKFSQQRLDDTRILAPFNAIILEKHITPSQWVNEGDVIFKVASTDYVDISVSMSDTAWQRIGHVDKSTVVKIYSPSGNQWQASLRYAEPSLNTQTRQRGLMLQVANPYSANAPLLPEQQVDVVFTGKAQANVVEAPATVMTPDHKVWSVIDNQLVLESVEIIEELPNAIKFRYINSPEKPRTLVLFPLSTMLEGQRVTTELVEAGDL